MDEIDRNKLVTKLRNAANLISNRKGDATYISLNETYIQEQAIKNNVSFEEIVEIIKNKLLPI
jgi:hypothetical protein